MNYMLPLKYTATSTMAINKEDLKYPQNGRATTITGSVGPDYCRGKLPALNLNRNISSLFKLFNNAKFLLLQNIQKQQSPCQCR